MLRSSICLRPPYWVSTRLYCSPVHNVVAHLVGLDSEDLIDLVSGCAGGSAGLLDSPLEFYSSPGATLEATEICGS
jgi:hypothetical protein